MGLADRHKPLPGDVFNIDWDGRYDVIMLPNKNKQCLENVRRGNAHALT